MSIPVFVLSSQAAEDMLNKRAKRYFERKESFIVVSIIG